MKLYSMFFLLLAIACSKDEEVEPQIIELNPSTISGISWVCESLEAHLMGVGTEQLDKEANQYITNYIPTTWVLVFSGTNCDFMVSYEGSYGVTSDRIGFIYEIKSGTRIVFKSHTDKPPAFIPTGYIKGEKLYLRFMCDDFKTLTDVLKADYPYYPSLIEHTKGGYVDVVFKLGF